MILTEEEIKNLMTTYHGNEAFVVGVAVGKSIEFHKAMKAFNKSCGWLSTYPWYEGVRDEFAKSTEE